MRTVVPDPPPAEFRRLLEHRRRTGADHHDEVWEGVLHMAPAPHFHHAELQAQLIEILAPPARAAGLRLGAEFNLGTPEDYRVPDGGLLDRGPAGLYQPTARLAIEILSPGDETWAKLPFYAAHHVDELLIIDPAERKIDWLTLTSGEYRPLQRSTVVKLTTEDLAASITWP